jgi:hypothetical protein
MRWALAILFALLVRHPLSGATAADIARAIRENSFDADECYRVRDLKLIREDIRLYFTDGHLIFSKPVEGRRIAAVFTTDVEGGDGEVLLLPPDRGERATLARYVQAPNLNDHFRAAVLLFTGDEYEQLHEQLPSNPANKKVPEMGAILDQEWTPILRNLGASYQTRLTLELLGGPARRGNMFAAMISSPKLGNFDVVYDPDSPDQIFAGQMVTRDNRLYFDTWTSFVAKSMRKAPPPSFEDVALRDYRIEATVATDLGFSAITRVKVKPAVDGTKAVSFDISPQMEISAVTVDGRPAEWLQREALRLNLSRGGNGMFIVVPPEPLRAGRDHEFEFRYSGNVIHSAGDRVFFISGRASWYPTHGFQFSNFDMLFRIPRDLELVSPGDVVEDRVEGEQRIVRSRTSAPIRIAGFNLGNYEHARVERGGYRVEVVANRALEKALQPRPQPISAPSLTGSGRPRRPANDTLSDPALMAPINPLERLNTMADEIASALEFMASKFGPPALPRLTVSPIPGAFGQGFPGLVYLSTLAYLKHLPRAVSNQSESQELFFADILQAHETAHQWWGNRVTAASYRDYWLMEALANYSALLYVEKSRGAKSVDTMLESYRAALIEKNEAGKTVESSGPIVLGPRLESSIEPRAWRIITYGKGSWIIHMLRRRMGDERFFSLLAELAKRYDHKKVSTEEFRALAAELLPPKSADPKLEGFFEQWVYSTGVPALKLTYSVKGKAPALRVVGTLEQSEVDEDFTVLVPVEIQIARGRTITHWVQSGGAPVSFTVPVSQPPSKVLLDPKRAILRR